MSEKSLQRKEEKIAQLEKKNSRLQQKVTTFMENMRVLRE